MQSLKTVDFFQSTEPDKEALTAPSFRVCSNRLFEAHDAHSHGATLQSPDDGQFKVHVNIIGFVGDTYSAVNVFDEKKDMIEEILKKAQFDAQLRSDY